MSLDTERLMKNARVHLPGALDTVLLLELYNTVDQFLQESNIWQEDIEFAVSSANDASAVYYIEPQSTSAIVRLSGVTNSDDRPIAAMMDTPGEIVLAHAPSEDSTYTATVVLTIDDPVDPDGFPEFPQWIMNKYATSLLDGLVGRMMSQPAKPYTNPALGLNHLRKFRNAISFAGTESVRRNVANSQAWRFPPF